MHLVGTNPTLNLQRDLELIEHLDRLGYDEAWIGEHHSAGSETIASPEVMIAAAAERTRHIKLGTGVSSLPYHHPLVLADRIVMLDHLTRGRMMFGVGPGQLTTDATMLGIDTNEQRRMMEESFDVMMALFKGETVTVHSDWFTCEGARLQMHPYSDPLFDVAVAASISPAGPKTAGKHGAGLLSIAATNPLGFEMLAGHWKVMEEQAAHYGTVVDRRKWRMMGPMHIAETEEQALENCRYGLGVGVQLPVPHHPDESHDRDHLRRAGAGAELDGFRRRRHAGDGDQPDPTAHRRVGWVRLLPLPRRRPRGLASDAAVVRAVRAVRHAPLQGPARARRRRPTTG